MNKIFATLLAIAALATACKKDPRDNGVFKGPEVKVHNGKAWTWVQLKDDGTPERLAVTINQAALNSVPGPDPAHAGDGESHDHSGDENNFVLKLHPRAAATLFNHVWLNWNPAGHEPPGIYDIPHFDIHYYLTSVEERSAAVDPVKMDIVPGTDYLPANYISPAPGVPQMGRHWVDVTSPEFNGQLFTQTFIYGSYDGKITFYEPMITKAFLQNTTSFERSIPQPAKFQKSGYYPTKLRVVRHDGVTEIVLEGFVFKQAS